MEEAGLTKPSSVESSASSHNNGSSVNFKSVPSFNLDLEEEEESIATTSCVSTKDNIHTGEGDNLTKDEEVQPDGPVSVREQLNESHDDHVISVGSSDDEDADSKLEMSKSVTAIKLLMHVHVIPSTFTQCFQI